jgi:hypothetical protein
MAKDKQSNLNNIIQMEFKVFQESGLYNFGIFDPLTNEFKGVRIIDENSDIKKIETEDNIILKKLNVEEYLELILGKNHPVKEEESSEYDVKFFGRRTK